MITLKSYLPTAYVGPRDRGEKSERSLDARVCDGFGCSLTSALLSIETLTTLLTFDREKDLFSGDFEMRRDVICLGISSARPTRINLVQPEDASG